MDRIEYCGRIQSKHFLPLVTDFFDQTMSLYHIGCKAKEITADVKSGNPVFELSFESEIDAQKIQNALRGKSLQAFNTDYKINIQKRNEKNIIVNFLDTPK